MEDSKQTTGSSAILLSFLNKALWIKSRHQITHIDINMLMFIKLGHIENNKNNKG